MTSPAGFWVDNTPGDPDNMNAGVLQRVVFASLPTKTSLRGMTAVVSDGVGGNGGPEAVYTRLDGTATWTLLGTLKGIVGVRCTDASSQSISSGSETAVNFDTEQFDSDSFHDNVTNNTRLTVPTGMGGKYLIVAFGEMDLAADDFWRIGIKLNAATYLAEHSITTGTFNDPAHTLSTSMIYDLAVADYVEMVTFQNTGGALSITKQAFAFWKLD